MNNGLALSISRHFGAGDGGFGIELAVVVALHDIQAIQQFDSFLAVFVDAGGVLISGASVASKGGDREDHRQSQSECEQFLKSAHVVDSSL